MSYYSKTKTDLSMIGAEAFALLDNSFSAATAPPSRTQPQMFPYQYKAQQSYVVQQTQRTGKVINCYEAVDKYGGALVVEYPKRKTSARKYFFY
ncbi:hypothetical protein Hanom_Chr17g01530131 [Helianthus anomalus]